MVKVKSILGNCSTTTDTCLDIISSSSRRYYYRACIINVFYSSGIRTANAAYITCSRSALIAVNIARIIRISQRTIHLITNNTANIYFTSCRTDSAYGACIISIIYCGYIINKLTTNICHTSYILPNNTANIQSCCVVRSADHTRITDITEFSTHSLSHDTAYILRSTDSSPVK